LLLASEQRIAALLLFGLALLAWIGVALWKGQQPVEPKPHYRTWEERKDSMRRVDSLRYAQWAAEREQRYDSFRVADSMRRAEWKRTRQAQYDAFRREDSLWRDSVGFRFPKHIKKDTVLDLNRCDTAELQLIRGIGRYTAIQIIQYREQLGGFYSPSQLTDEPLADLHLDTLLAHFTADTADIRKIRVNSASVETLQRHPYLRFQQAKAIYTLRRQRVTLHSPADLQSLPELPDSTLLRLSPYLSFE